MTLMQEVPSGYTADDAVRRLIDGNERFVRGEACVRRERIELLLANILPGLACLDADVSSPTRLASAVEANVVDSAASRDTGGAGPNGRGHTFDSIRPPSTPRF
jgi:hypothetical protein